MYSIQTTPGLIIDSKPYGEAGKTISIFTRDLGLVRAIAQGIRLEKSKLRYHVRDYGFGVFSFVRGKDYWRLTSASAEDGKPREIMIRAAQLLKRLLHGEEPHSELFDVISQADRFLNQSTLNDEQLKTLESTLVLKIMHNLGYVGREESLNECLGPGEITMELLESCASKRVMMNQIINKGLKESHL